MPWQGLKGDNKKQHLDKTMEKSRHLRHHCTTCSNADSAPEMTTPTEVLCRGFPNEFAIFLDYSRSLRYDEKPDYVYCRQLFRDLFVREGFKYDYIFDWSVAIDDEEEEEEEKNMEEHVRTVDGPEPAMPMIVEAPVAVAA